MRFVRAGAASLLLSILFFTVYGSCNALTAVRPDVGTWSYAWERSIPFVDWMILPYLSMDVFYFFSTFVCRGDAELLTLSKRLSCAILCAGACFLLYPLRLDFPPPQVSGRLGALFTWFLGMDRPYNLLPSLHIALAALVGATYFRHTRGFLRGLVALWFILIGASTVLTHQHQVVDVAGGGILAVYCFYLCPSAAVAWPVVKNPHVGLLYGAGGLVCGLLASRLGHVGLLLAWPAVSMGILASAYLGLGPGMYRKTDGRLSWSTRFVLGPILLGQHLSLLYYQRQCRPWDEVVPGMWIGRVLSEVEAAQAVQQGVTAVLDLTAEFSEAKAFRQVVYRHLPILDLTAPTQDQLRTMAAFLAEQVQHGIVYVHCKVGYSRSASAVGAYLLRQGRAGTLDEAMAWLQRVRPSIVVRAEIRQALKEFARTNA